MTNGNARRWNGCVDVNVGDGCVSRMEGGAVGSGQWAVGDSPPDRDRQIDRQSVSQTHACASFDVRHSGECARHPLLH